MKNKIETVSLIPESDLLDGLVDVREAVNDGDLDVSFGDANRTLLSTDAYKTKVLDKIDIGDGDREAVIARLNELPAGTYIDMEN